MQPNDKKLERNLENLNRLMSVLDSAHAMTQQDFMASFEKVLMIVKNAKELLAQQTQELRASLVSALKLMEEKHGKMSDSFRKELLTKCETLIKQANRELEKKIPAITDLSDIEKRLSEIKTLTIKDVSETLPSLGVPIRNSLELLQGNERLSRTAIAGIDELEKMLGDRIAAMPKGGGGGSGGGVARGAIKFHDLSSQTDGSTKTFTVPKSVTAVVLSSDFPTILMESNGFTFGNAYRTQITLTPTNAPSSGSQLLFQYSPVFST